MSSLTVAQAREQFAELLNRASYAKERIIVVRRNRKMAALVPIEDLEALEALEDQLDLKEVQKILAKPMAAIPWTKVKTELHSRKQTKKSSKAT